MLKDLFYKKKKYATIPSERTKKDIPEGIMMKCPQCKSIIVAKELEKNLKICSHCEYHFSLSAKERIAMLLDDEKFFEYDANMISKDPLNFPDYPQKVAQAMEKTDLNEAVVTGEGTIGGYPVAIGVMDSRFIMASMGSVVGEKNNACHRTGNYKKIPFYNV